MRMPAQIKPWLSTEEMAAWLREAPSKEAYKRRLAIWLTHIDPFHAHQVATMLQVSTQAVWLWLKQYNERGPQAIERKGRGGRRWSYLSWPEEEALLYLHTRASKGELITAKKILKEVHRAPAALSCDDLCRSASQRLRNRLMLI
jgi:transposase